MKWLFVISMCDCVRLNDNNVDFDEFKRLQKEQISCLEVGKASHKRKEVRTCEII